MMFFGSRALYIFAQGGAVYPTAVAVISFALLTPANSQAVSEIFQSNRAEVQKFFDDWTNLRGNFFDLLAPNAVITMLGTGPSSGTWNSTEHFMREVARPFLLRLSTPLKIQVKEIDIDDAGEHVAVRFDDYATAKDGQPYSNHYAWFFTMKDVKAVEAVMFLDLQRFDAVKKSHQPVYVDRFL